MKHPRWFMLGERNSMAVLTRCAVRRLRHRRVRGATFRELAEQCSVHRTTVSRAVHGLTWGWLR